MTRLLDPLRDLARAHLSLRTRRRIALSRLALRRPTAQWRALPDFLVIGGQRCGTSSLYRYLCRHPSVAAPLRKEVEYLSSCYAEGELWYRAHFPLRNLLPGAPRKPTFEATPDYLFHPRAADRAAALMPDLRLIVIVRDPVERAWSHWRHNRRLGLDPLPFEEAVEREEERIAPDLPHLASDTAPRPRRFLRFSYARRGRYAEQIARWLEHYPAERLLVLQSDELFRDPAATYDRILDFLRLPADPARRFPNYSYAPGRKRDAAIPAGAAARLRTALADEDRKLSELLGREIRW